MSKSYILEEQDMDLHVTYDEHPDPEDFERHCHDLYELLYVTQGVGRYVVEGQSYPLKAGTLFLFRPREFHYVEPSPEHPYERSVIHFSPAAVQENVLPLLYKLAKRTESGNFYNTGEVPITASSTFDRIHMIKQFPREESILLAKLFLSEIIVALSVALPSKPEESDPLGLRVVQYLNDHLTEKISLEELAKRFFVSKYYICRAFRSHNGVSILQYLTEKRIYLARQLMEKGETAVSAAMESGFGDYSSFYRAYMRIIGAAPSGREVKEKTKTNEK